MSFLDKHPRNLKGASLMPTATRTETMTREMQSHLRQRFPSGDNMRRWAVAAAVSWLLLALEVALLLCIVWLVVRTYVP